MNTIRTISKIIVSLLVMSFTLSADAGKPLKVYILAGQSNMEGHAKVETFDYTGGDSTYASLLKDMRGPDGKPTVCDKVWISYFTGMKSFGEGFGKLTSGYGARRNPAEDGGKIGPEFTFGITMEKATNEPILIIKTAWGGKSLHTDFRSPSAGPYELSDWQLKNYPKQEGHGIPKDLEKWKIEKKAATGLFYRLMVKHVKHVLSDIKRVYPDYDEKQGYKIAGFSWFQGFNDMVGSHEYPRNGNKPGRYDLYSKLLAHFIRDVRKDFNAPKMPFVIGVMGVGGIKGEPDYFREAMAAPASLPEFKGNVVAVQTAPFWDAALGAIDVKNGQIRQMSHFLRSKHKNYANKDGKMTQKEQQAFLKDFRAKLISPEEELMRKRGASNAGYHYLGCAKTMGLIGKAFADALLEMSKK
jgi:hypothetical protein